MTFVDTNYFLRFLLNDISNQHQQAKILFKKGAAGEVTLFTSVIVIFEVYWVMVATYDKTKAETIEILRNVLALSFIQLEARAVFERALDLFEEKSVELEDCYNLVYANKNNVTDFATFDKKLRKLVG